MALEAECLCSLQALHFHAQEDGKAEEAADGGDDEKRGEGGERTARELGEGEAGWTVLLVQGA